MIFYILLPILLLLMVVFQATILDHLIFGKTGIDLALIFVMYLGLRLKPITGGILSLLIGYYMDCITGSLSGLHAFTYVGLFFIAKLFFSRMQAGRMTFVALFCFMSILLEGFIVLVFYNILYGFDIWHNMLLVTLPRAVVGGLVSPVLFKIFNVVEIFLGYGNTGPFERA
jgi:rod shape-determining protein MreD